MNKKGTQIILLIFEGLPRFPAAAFLEYAALVLRIGFFSPELGSQARLAAYKSP